MKLSDKEWRVLDALWASEDGLTLEQIQAEIARRTGV